MTGRTQPVISASTTLVCWSGDGEPARAYSERMRSVAASPSTVCTRCTAWRGELGSEPTPDLFIAHLLEVFRQVRRVLRDDGLCVVNLGDSYAGSGKGPTGHNGIGDQEARQGFSGYSNKNTLNGGKGYRGKYTEPVLGGGGAVDGIPAKNLLLIPQRFLLAAQADGWIVRSVLPWVKRNAMPESVTDRPTTATEWLFVLAKKRAYYWDAEAIRQTHARLWDENNGGSMSTGRRDDALRGAFDVDVSPRTSRPYPEPNPNGRNYRTSDPFFTSLDLAIAAARAELAHLEAIKAEGGLLLDADGEPVALQVNPQPYPGAHYACVDEETECLTIEGWKRHDEVLPGMLAAQYDMERQALMWAPVQDVARYFVADEPMIAAKSRDVEMLLTPNHRTIVTRRLARTSRAWQPLKVIRADQLRPSHAIPVSAEWEQEGAVPFSNDWAELLGWYIAEGHASKVGWAVEIYQSKAANPEKVERIRSLLEFVGADFTEVHAPRMWRGRSADMAAFQVRGFASVALRQWAPGKQFHPDTLRWDAGLLESLLRGLVDGDGHRRSDGRVSFIQRSRDMAGMAQAIGVRLGYSTMMTRRSEGTYTVYFTRKRLISFRGTAGEGAEITTRPYSGVVWCPKLPAGTWVARKNGRAFITGNTFPPDLVEPFVKAGTPERGCCPTCGTPWRRVVERMKGREIITPKAAALAETGFRHGVDGSTLGIGGRGNGGAWAEHGSKSATLGWSPACRCAPAEPVPSTILDCFGGAGTVGLVADRLGRDAILCELNAEYAEQARARLVADAPMLATVEAVGGTAPRPLPLFEEQAS